MNTVRSRAPPLISNPTRRTGFLSMVNAERIKFFTLKSGPITTVVLAAFIVISAFMSSLSLVTSSPNSAVPSPVTTVEEVRFVDTVLWMAVVYAVVAALFSASEYTSGQIQPSILASPKRTPVVFAKASVIGVLGFLVGLITSSTAMLVPLAVLAGTEVSYDVALSEAAILAVASGLFMGLTGIVSLAFGLVVKNVIIAIAVPVLLFSILPSMLESIGNDIVTTAVGFLPSVAGRVALTTFPNPAGLDSWTGMAVLGGWALLLTALASLVLRARDV